MKSILEYLTNEIELTDFDVNIYNKIPMDDDFRLPDDLIKDPDTKLFTIIFNNKPVGITGFIKKKNRYYFQIAIFPEFRGLNILKKSADLIKQKFKIKKLISIIEKNNIASIKSHAKAGFKRDTMLEKEIWNNKKYVYIY